MRYCKKISNSLLSNQKRSWSVRRLRAYAV
nr:MAG TPA: hypothetical protein [Caudoviricetes sp.]